jgi:hypothetical protein
MRLYAQLWTATVERCLVSGVALVSMIETWSCHAGGTNRITVTTTNQFAPFLYQYYDTGSASYVTATGFPIVTTQAIVRLTKAVNDCIPYFVDMAAFGTNSSYLWTNNVVATSATELATIEVPMLTDAVLADTGAGWLETSGTNRWGITNSAVGWWWYGDETGDAETPLFAARYYSNAWQTCLSADTPHNGVNIRCRDRTNVVPQGRYQAGSGLGVTNDVSIRLVTRAIVPTNETLLTVTQTLVFAASPTQTLSYWADSVLSISTLSGSPSNNDSVVIVYTNALRYGTPDGSVVPPRLYWRTFQVLKDMLHRMHWTKFAPTIVTAGYPYWRDFTFDRPTTVSNQALLSSRWPTNLSATLLGTVHLGNQSDPRVNMSSRETHLTAVTSLTTNFAKQGDLYIAVTEPTGSGWGGITQRLFHAWDMPYRQYQYMLLASTNSPAGEYLTNAVPLHTLNIGTNIPWEVIGTAPNSVVGYEVAWARWIIRWNVAGGFSYP